MLPRRKEQMKAMMREQSAAASPAQQQTEQTAEGRKEARVAFKKGEGNTAFKAGEFQQAAVFYTEALTLDATSSHMLLGRRALLISGALPFEQVRPTQLPFFKFLLVDDVVAVAQGRSGGVAVWVREG